MELSGALRRGGLGAYLEAAGEALRARSRVFWVVAGVTALAAALRFATLGLQAYHHDEVVTASRVLRSDFWHAMDAVGFSESAPPLYYALAWLWTQLTGTGEFGLRSLSALFGVATVPVAYLLCVELLTQTRSAVPSPRHAGITHSGASWAGVVAAALVAVNPMLLWYAQEARAYALLVLLTALATLYFARSLGGGGRRESRLWGLFGGLALATHYFAVFPLAVQALWLLRRRGRAARDGLAILAAFAVALAPLALHQMQAGRAEWIANHSLGHRLWEVGATFTVGEIGDLIARAETIVPALAPLAAIAAALALLAWRGDRAERRAGGLMLAVAGGAIGIPLALALLSPDRDYILARNLIPALLPLLVAVAVGCTLGAARRRGAAIAAVLFVYSLGFSLYASLAPALHRPDWQAVAERLGEPEKPRAMVAWTIGHASLRYYLSTGSFQVRPDEGFSWFVHEIDFISDGAAPPVPSRLLGPGFRQVGYERLGRLHIRRYAMPGEDLGPLRLGPVRRADLNFRSNGVLLDGIGVP